MTAGQEAIDNYLVWELCKKEGIQERIMEQKPDGEKLKQRIVEKVKKEYQKEDYKQSQKINQIWKLDNNPEYRSKIFKNCSWKKETVSVKDLGTTLPRLGDLPAEVISGSLKEVVEFVREANPEEYRDINYIKSLEKVPEVLDQFHPWVITPGNRLEKLDRMKNVHGEKEWDIKDTWGMINDGNHRTIAKILAENLNEIECYVGYRED